MIQATVHLEMSLDAVAELNELNEFLASEPGARPADVPDALLPHLEAAAERGAQSRDPLDNPYARERKRREAFAAGGWPA